MENHHHEEPKPTNKWIATPIILAVVVIALITGMFSMVSGPCCNSDKCEAKNKTEQHGATHEDEHGEVKHEEAAVDTTKAATDSTATTEKHDEHAH